MGCRELFDYALKHIVKDEVFKHPTPADFFRTMEDRIRYLILIGFGEWFYTNDHVDISLENVNWYKINTGNPDIENPIARENEKIKKILTSDIEKMKYLFQKQ